jgi:hypothetical protein
MKFPAKLASDRSLGAMWQVRWPRDMEVLVDVEKASAGICPLNTGAEPTGFRAVRRMQAVSHGE